MVTVNAHQLRDIIEEGENDRIEVRDQRGQGNVASHLDAAIDRHAAFEDPGDVAFECVGRKARAEFRRAQAAAKLRFAFKERAGMAGGAERGRGGESGGIERLEAANFLANVYRLSKNEAYLDDISELLPPLADEPPGNARLRAWASRQKNRTAESRRDQP